MESQFIKVIKGKETANYLSESESDDSEREVENIDGGDSLSDSDDEHAFKRRKTRGKKKSSYVFSESESDEEIDKSDYYSLSSSLSMMKYLSDPSDQNV